MLRRLYLTPTFPRSIVRAIINDFGLKVRNKSRLCCLGIKWVLLSESEEGNNVVLIIDEAQNLRLALEQSACFQFRDRKIN